MKSIEHEQLIKAIDNAFKNLKIARQQGGAHSTSSDLLKFEHEWQESLESYNDFFLSSIENGIYPES